MIFFYLNLFFALVNLSYYNKLHLSANLIIGLLNLFTCLVILIGNKNA